MFVKSLAVSIVIGLFAWETVQAASISTRVRVLENKVNQFERQIKKERSDQNASVEMAKKNAEEIEALNQRVNQVHSDLMKMMPKKSKAGASYLTDKRFTDSRYSYP